MLIAVVVIVTQTSIMFVMLMVRAINEAESNVDQWIADLESNGLVLSIATVGTALICVPFVKFLTGRREVAPWTFLRLKPASVRSIGSWSLALVVFVVASDLITAAIGRPVVPEFVVDAYGSAPPVLLFAALVFAAPVFEEIFFRGFIIGVLESSGVSALVAAIVSSAAWSAIHLQYDLYAMAIIFLMGLLLAAARSRTRSLLPCMAMHAIANAIAFTETAVIAAG